MANIFRAKSLISRTGVFSNEVLSPNLIYNTGDQSISGSKTFFDPAAFSTSQAEPFILSNNPLSVVGSGDYFLQLNIQNRGTGNAASSDLVLTSDNGTEVSNYIDLGINSSQYNNGDIYSLTTGNDGYLYINGGNLVIGTQTDGKVIKFHVNGSESGDQVAEINANGVIAANLVYNTTDQNISGVKNFYSRPTVNGTGVLLSGEAANLPDTIVYTSGNQTISGIKTFDIAPVVSGNSLITGDLSLYATTVNLASTGLTLTNSINSLSGIFTGFTGNLDLTYATDTQLFNTGSTLDIKINSLSGSLNTSGINLTNRINLLSGVSVLSYGNQNITGNKTFINNIEVQGTGIFNALDLSNISDFSFSGVTINLIDSTVQSSGQIYISGNPVSTGTVILPNTIVYTTGDQIISGIKDFYDQLRTFGDVDLNYAPFSNKRIRIWTTGLSAGAPIPFIGTLIDISGIYIQNGMVLKINDVEVTPSLYATIDNLASTGLNLSNSIDSLSGLFTGYTGNLDSTFATDIQLFNTGSTLDTKIDTLSGSAVLLYGNQTVDGLKDFTTRPTVNTTPVLLSGEYAAGLNLLVKNDESFTLYKGQPVYINSAAGNNLLIKMAVNTGEDTSSKTLGILYQDLAPNAQGYVITEGQLEGINTDAGNAGDPIWLGPTGDLIFGLAQKPYAPNHLVYLGVIERKQANNGKIYVKVQNGFELEELHNVDINHRYSLNNDDVLRYDSASGIWYNRPINTGIFQTQISSLSGTLTSDYATIINLALTGNTLNTNLGNTGLNLNNSINSLSGVSVLTYGNQNITGNKTFINNITVSGTGTFNAIDLDNIDNLSLSGVDVTLINSNVNVSGNIFISGNPVLTGVNLTPYATTVNLALTGLNLSNNISSLSGTLTGDYVTKNNGLFTNTPTVNGTNVLLSGEPITSGDLTGYLPYPTVNKLQGYKVDLSTTPAPGQVLEWNGTSWAAGTIPLGGGGGGGRFYYFNFLNTTGIAPSGGLPTTADFPLSLLGRSYAVGSGLALSADLDPQGTEHLICGFVSASGDPGITNIPAGLWDFNIWAKVNSANATQSSMLAKVHIYNPNDSTYRLLGTSDDVYLYDTETIAQYILNVTVPQTGILSTERIYIEIYGKKYTSAGRQITMYFDSYRPSHVHTTIPSVAGNGVVKVIDGVFQTPATGIFDNDVDNNANIAQSKIANLASDLTTIRNTGTALDNKIGSLSGTLTSDYATIVNVALTGVTLNSSINSLSGLFTGYTGTLDATYATDIQLLNTGITLNTRINNLSGYINSTSSNIVFTTGNQIISGVKTFAQDATFGDTGQGDFLVISGNNFIVYGSGNFTSGLFVNGNPVLTGVDLTPYATTSNLALTGSTLDAKINSLSGTLTGNYLTTSSASNTYATISNLNTTGSTLTTNLASTGSTLDTKINNLSGYINSTGSNVVFTTGDQAISGNKTFNNTITTRTISGLSGVGGTSDSISLNGIDNAYNVFSSNFAGGNIVLDAGSGNFAGGYIYLNGGNAGNTSYGGGINVNGNVSINSTNSSELASRTINIYKTGIVFGNPAAINALTIDNNNVSLNAPGGGGQGFGLVISGVLVTPALYATSANLASTGSNLNSNITSLSGLFTGYTGTLDATYATDLQLLNTGITLNTRINNLSGYVNSTSSNIVFTTGNQNIGGNKTFTGVTTFSGQEVNLVDTALNLSGLGDMTFSGTNINFINSPVFISGTNLRVAGDVLGNNLVYKTGNQTISGTKTFTDGILNVSIKPQNSGLEIDNGPFIIRSADGTHGAVRVEVLNENGANGFTVINEGLDLADFGLQSSSNKKINFRMEGRSQYANGNNQEFQVIDVSDNINGVYYARFGNNNIVIGENSEKVGIGTLSPVSKLHVQGDASNNSTLKVGTLELQPYAVNNAWFGDNTYYSGGFYRREAGYAGAFYFQGPEGQFRFAGTDDAGTTYTPAVQLKIHLDGRFGVGSNISTNTSNFTNSKFFVNSNGNVGINTLTPSEKLQVNGNVLISGNTTVSGSINISGNYDIYSQIENVKKLAIAYAIAL